MFARGLPNMAKDDLATMTLRVVLLLFLASIVTFVAAEGRPSLSSGPPVLRAPGDRYFLLTPAPLRQELIWGLDNIPVRAQWQVKLPPRDINLFDYSLPASYRRANSGVSAVRPGVQYGQQYVAWVDAEVHKFYSRRFGEQVQVALGSAGQQYLFDAKQALLLHKVQKGLRKVSTTMNLDQTPFDDPVENVRLRGFLESSFENLRQSPHPHTDTYPHLLRLALLRIRQQQKAEPMYQTFPAVFDGNWDIVFPFLQDERLDMVEFLLRPS